MTQLILNIENPSILPKLREMLAGFDGVSISNTSLKKKSVVEKRLENSDEDVVVFFLKRGASRIL